MTVAKAKKAPVKRGQTFGKNMVPRTRVAILDGTGGKDKYLAKYTIYNVAPADVQQAVKLRLDGMQREWEAAQKPGDGPG
jgi:hypothetical protein